MVASVSAAAGANHTSGRWRAQASSSMDGRDCIRSPEPASGVSAESPPLDVAVGYGLSVAERSRSDRGRRILRTARRTRRLAGLALAGVASLTLISVTNHHGTQGDEGGRSWLAFLCGGGTWRRPLASSVSLAAGGPEGKSEDIDVSDEVEIDVSDEVEEQEQNETFRQKNWTQRSYIQGDGRTLVDILPRVPEEWLPIFEEKKMTQPTPIQAVVMSKLANGLPSAIIRSETGSGKTYAYLLPALLRLYDAEVENDELAKVLVITPTRELAVQLYVTAREFCRYPVALVAPSQKASWYKVLEAGVVIATPVELLQALAPLHWSESKYFFNQVQTFVIDEFDAMIGADHFRGKQQFLFQDKKLWPAEGLIRRLMRHNNRTDLQVVAVSATSEKAAVWKFNKAIFKDPYHRFPWETYTFRPRIANSHALMGMSREEQAKLLADENRTRYYPTLPAGIQHYHWTLIGGEHDFAAAAAAALMKRRPKSALIFVCPNAGQSVVTVVEELQRYGFENVESLAREMFPNARSSGRQVKSSNKVEKDTAISAWRLQNLREETSIAGADTKLTVEGAQVYVAAEHQARGLDIPGVEAVLVLGLPSGSESYMHMAGRTGRLPHPYGDAILVGQRWMVMKVRKVYAPKKGLDPGSWKRLGRGYGDVKEDYEEQKEREKEEKKGPG